MGTAPYVPMMAFGLVLFAHESGYAVEWPTFQAWLEREGFEHAFFEDERAGYAIECRFLNDVAGEEQTLRFDL